MKRYKQITYNTIQPSRHESTAEVITFDLNIRNKCDTNKRSPHELSVSLYIEKLRMNGSKIHERKNKNKI